MLFPFLATYMSAGDTKLVECNCLRGFSVFCLSNWHVAPLFPALVLRLSAAGVPSRGHPCPPCGSTVSLSRELNFCLNGQPTSCGSSTAVVGRPERVCPCVLRLGAHLAALCMLQEACPGWDARRPVIQVSHHTGCQSAVAATHCLPCRPQPRCCQPFSLTFLDA